MAFITLLTDFGLQDEYVGVMKGVILNIDPNAVLIDVTHGISAQNVVEAAFTLKAAFGVFPQGSIHLAVVDPGVGTDRDIIAVPWGGHILMAPDNGLLWPIIADSPPETIFRVENESLFRHPVGKTFHGRDIFAPVAAYLSGGGDIKAIGSELSMDKVQPLPVAMARAHGNRRIQGIVVSVDRFGNLVTNIHRSTLSLLESGTWVVHVGEHRIAHWSDNYAAGKPETPLAIVGSRDCLEIAVNGGHAARLLETAQGAAVDVQVVAP